LIRSVLTVITLIVERSIHRLAVRSGYELSISRDDPVTPEKAVT
jgi:hypothetical protein